MNTHADHVLLEALALAPDDRSVVALSLVDSLQGDATLEEEITKAGVAEARRRSDDIRTGRTIAIPLDEFRSWLNSL